MAERITTLDGFRAKFPEFSATSDVDVNNSLDFAIYINNLKAEAAYLIAAHVLQLKADKAASAGGGGGGGSGTVVTTLSSEQLGDMKIDYSTTTSSTTTTKDDIDSVVSGLKNTIYGNMYLLLRSASRKAIGARVVG